jgi:cyanophycinase
VDVTLVGGGWDVAAQRQCLQPFFAAASARAGGTPSVGVVLVDEGDGYGERVTRLLEQVSEHQVVDLSVKLGETLDPARLAGVDGIFVCGGLTPAYATALQPAAEELRRLVLEDGIPYAGTSAGAAVAATRAVVGGYLSAGRVVCPPDAGEDLEEVTVTDGVGLVAEAVDVHAASWGTLARLEAALATAGVPVGLGIDEDTAWHVTDRGARVLGRGAVHRLERTASGVSWTLRLAAD